MTETMKRNKVGSTLTEGPILKCLLLFSIPIILTNLIQQLYSMVDLAVVGEWVGINGTIGVNTGGEMADLVLPVATGFSMAGQIYIAQLFGANQIDKVKKAIGTLLSLMCIFSIVLAIVAIVFCDPILNAINCPSNALADARAYMIITAIGYPFVFCYNAVCGVLRGMGESKRPLLFIIIAATINIFMDIFLVTAFHMGTAGTAIATTLSQFGSFLASFIFLWKKRDQFDFQLSLNYFTPDKESMIVLVKLGIPQVVRSLLVRSSMLWVNSTANAYGSVVSATNSVGNKIQKFLEVFVQGVDTASSSMVGQNLGAGKVERAGKTTLYTCTCTVFCATITSILALNCPNIIFGLFTKEPEVLELGARFLQIFVLHFYVSAVIGAFQAMVMGCGFVELGFVLGVLDGVVCKIGLSLIFINVFNMGYEGLWWGVSCSRIIPCIICICYYISGRWKTRKLLVK